MISFLVLISNLFMLEIQIDFCEMIDIFLHNASI